MNIIYLSIISLYVEFSVGSSTQESDYLKFLFEGSEDFCVIPSFAVVPAFSAMFASVPGMEVDPTKVICLK